MMVHFFNKTKRLSMCLILTSTDAVLIEI